MARKQLVLAPICLLALTCILNIGGVKPAADVWLNNRHIGFTRSSRSPLKADVTDCVRFGDKNTLSIRVAWPKVRLDGVWDWEDCMWGGIYRSVFLESTTGAWIDQAWVRTEAAKRLAHVELALRGPKHGGGDRARPVPGIGGQRYQRDLCGGTRSPLAGG